MEFEQFYNSLPKFSRFYMITVFVVTFCISYVRFVPVGYWTVLDLDLVIEKFQIWRYNTLTRMEKKAIELKRYAEFTMLLIYTSLFVLFISITMNILFGMDLSPFLSFEMLFALIYIEAKRDPEKMVMVYFVTVKNAFVPWVLIFFSMVTGGNIVSDLIGIAAGHLYYYFKDLAPLNHGWDILKTPQFLFNKFDRNPPRVTTTTNVRSNNNDNSSGTFGSNNSSNATSTFRQEGVSGTGNRFQPFSGRGSSWGQ